MENNQAVVAVLKNVTAIEGADNILKANVTVKGTSVADVVVGKDSFEGQQVVYFDSNLCLSNKLIEDNPTLATYLGKGNRVRCVKLRGVISDGLVVPVEKFESYGKLSESFNDIGSVNICSKWVPPAQPKSSSAAGRKKGAAPKGFNRVDEKTFHFHIDTKILAKNLDRINPDDVISISRKVHGTSAIVARVPCKRKLSFIEKMLSKFVAIDKVSYDYLYASRNTVKNAQLGPESSTDLWVVIGKKYFEGKLHAGETVYFEIVGYMPNTSKFIQKNYDYGCKPGETKIQVYRITSTNIDGVVTEYSWAAMKERCKELGVDMVEEFYFGKAADLELIHTLRVETDTEPDWSSAFLKELKLRYLEKDVPTNLCKKMPDEGVVIRREGLHIDSYKLKSDRFKLQESKNRDDGIEDTEDQEAAN
jgi:hypothetical protein